MFPNALIAQLRPSAELAVQLIGVTPEEADAQAKDAGFAFTAIDVLPGSQMALPANLIIGRIRGFVRAGLIQSVQVG